MATDGKGRSGGRGGKGGGKDGGKWRPEGRVSDQRKRKEPNPDLSDPRQAPWDESLRAERARRLHRPGKEPVRGAETSKDQVEEFTAAAYRYSKSPDFTNDELGYGEVITEELWQARDGKLVSLERRSQRTKTGRQVLEYLEPDDPSRTPVDRDPSGR